MLYGTVIGDIAGSRFEFGGNPRKKNFELFHYKDRFTDDTIMTLAIYEATKRIKESKCDDNEARKIFVEEMQKWGREYINAGYGSKFHNWIESADPHPYGSWGNGSAMRVAAIGNMFDTLEEVEYYATLSADVTHNHPEGIKGAKAIAGAIFIARTTRNKKKVKSYIASLGYKMCNSIFVRPHYKFDVSCQGTIPVAVEAFIESHNFEEAIRIAVSMGGDSDTIGAITGSIAEAYYGVPDDLKQRCKKYLDEHILNVIV